MTENFKNIAPFLNQSNKLPISENNRRLHTYITGGTGSGKSEAIKSLIWHYLTRDKRTGLVLLSPNGEICEQVAKFGLILKITALFILNQIGRLFSMFKSFDVPTKKI
ncbi:type IV secretion system DNA-binding domain-containing protein [Moraxella equi]|uniref:type IV secretion system DNA-binding domain-containing protein n=1 Tax=Moraxella equi TaxID=60442 RepID=UPI000E1BBB16|nr:type IV secretion system DNA-binding domain-containing protein [Moraxella equi]